VLKLNGIVIGHISETNKYLLLPVISMEIVVVFLGGIFATVVSAICAIVYYVVKSNEQRDLNFRASLKAGIVPGGYNAPGSNYSGGEVDEESKILEFLQSDTFKTLSKMMPKPEGSSESIDEKVK